MKKTKLKPFKMPAAHQDKRFVFLRCPMDGLTMQETVDIIAEAIEKGQAIQHVVVNTAKLVNLQKDQELKHNVAESDIINIDGQGVVWGARLLGHKVPERVTGVDLMDALMALCAEKGYRPYVLGATEVVLYKAVENIKKTYPAIEFAGYRNGYFDKEEEADVMQEIADMQPDMLFIAMPSPHKERIMTQYKDTLRIPFMMGVGGSVDVFAGVTKRAPKWMQKCGLEWFYRIMQEPARMWKRYLVTNTKYVFYLLREIVWH